MEFERCIGCEACREACPNDAIQCEEIDKVDTVKIFVEGMEVEVPRDITIKDALQCLGYSLTVFPFEKAMYFPCRTGGCYSCLVSADGRFVRACITPVRKDMVIRLDEEKPVKRIVSEPEGHSVGGVGTPWWVKGKGRAVEVAVWVAGCNLRCPQCQNHNVTYESKAKPLTPEEAALKVSVARKKFSVDRMAISGGEPTLNVKWLLRFFKELRKINNDRKARLHLDTNATILDKHYIDLLVEAGMTDIGPDLKGAKAETFMKITGITDRNLAEKYLNNSWETVKYVVDRYQGKVFIGVGVPYNSFFMDKHELREIGDKLVSIDEKIQVCVLDYYPVFKRRNILRPTLKEMMEARDVLLESGLKTVLAQTPIGHIGP